jgi:hypothetical protein
VTADEELPAGTAEATGATAGAADPASVAAGAEPAAADVEATGAGDVAVACPEAVAAADVVAADEAVPESLVDELVAADVGAELPEPAAAVTDVVTGDAADVAVDVADVAVDVTADAVELAVVVTDDTKVRLDGAGVAAGCGEVAACACLENTSKMARIPAATIAPCTARRATRRKVSCGIERLPPPPPDIGPGSTAHHQ